MINWGEILLEIRKAIDKDIDDVLNLYHIVIEQILNNESNPEWKRGIYPKDDSIINSILSGDLYVGVYSSEIVSAIVINDIANQDYEDIKWRCNCDNALYIHLVAVNQNYKKKGFAKEMLKYSFNLARNISVKSIRLNLHRKNLAIEPLYTKAGFELVDTIMVDDEDRGLINFNVYEKVLD
jgi:GNAT superfamily N-acetyltransferase